MVKREYWVRLPGKERKTFKIYERVNGKGGKPVQDSRVDAVNALYLGGTIDLDSATRQIQEIKIGLQAPFKSGERYPIAEVNRDIFEKYWATKYVRRKALADSKRSAKNYYLRALASIGSLSMMNSKIEDLQTAIDRNSPRKQRRICNCLNRILAFIRRTDRLALAAKQDIEYRYLEVKDFQKVIDKLEVPEVRLVCQVAFYSGLRLGEIFAVREFYEEDSTIYVERQMYENGTYGNTKNKKKRRSFVTPEGVKWVKLWLEIPTADRMRLRKLRWADLVGKACVEAFPKSSEKHLNFHDLRHSYAIYCLRRGLSLTVVAASLGDGLNVTQEYYACFEKTSEFGMLARQLWKAS